MCIRDSTIRALGVIQPIVVRPMGARSADGYEIVAGERRWRAAQLAGISVVPTIIRTLDERSSALYSLAENIARSDLNPMELARGYQSVLQEHDFSQTALAEAIGQNVKTVNRILRLLKLDAPVQELIERGSLTAKHGELLLGAPKPRQVELAQRAAEQQWSCLLYTSETAIDRLPHRRLAAFPSRGFPFPAHGDAGQNHRWSESFHAALLLRRRATAGGSTISLAAI